MPKKQFLGFLIEKINYSFELKIEIKHIIFQEHFHPVTSVTCTLKFSHRCFTWGSAEEGRGMDIGKVQVRMGWHGEWHKLVDKFADKTADILSNNFADNFENYTPTIFATIFATILATIFSVGFPFVFAF